MAPRLKQGLGGFVLALSGAYLTFSMWYQQFYRPDDTYYLIYPPAPIFFVLGVAAIFFPGYKEERLARGEDISGMHGWKLLTPRWRWVLIVAAAVAIGNHLLFELTNG